MELPLGQVFGAPIRLSLGGLLGAVLIASYSVGRWWAFPLLLVLVLVHELGHAVAVRWTGHRVLGLDLRFIHGQCRWMGRASARQEAWIAWGGVLAQATLFPIALGVYLTGFYQDSVIGDALFRTFGVINLSLIVINLLPVPPLDGARAWPYFRMLWFGRRTAEVRANFPKPKSLVTMDARQIADQAIREAMERSRDKAKEPE